ncbi:MAG TPA: hypothetical protein VMT45_07560 [Thermoanaerobaculaceae bacterium]|nr:hypothetical protein [Thermoanaerobaculaceae bacterium]
MATNVRIVHARDFIRATPEGRLDLEESKRLLAEIATAALPLTGYQILLDTRRAQVAMSVTDLWYLATDFWDIAGEIVNPRGRLPRRTAVLCPLVGFDRASFFALCAENQGLHVRAFTSFEDAIEWLIMDGT